MQNKKRYYGMTSSQIWILVGTAIFALCIVGVAFFFVLRSSSKLPAAQQSTSSSSSLTSTPKIRASDVPATATTAPVIATIVPPIDWIEFQTKDATLWLPPSFVGGDMVSQKQETINKINRLGKYFRNVVDDAKNADKSTILLMVDKTLRQTDIFPTARVEHEISTEDTSLDDYIQNILNTNTNGTPVSMLMTINETKKLTILGREAKRLTVSVTYAGHGATNLIYWIKDGADIWSVSYSMSPNEYFDMLPMFEQSIQTFNLLK